LSGATRGTVGKQFTQNSDAYRFYLQGRYEANKRTGEALGRAIKSFEQAIAADPNYALAYAGLADSYTLQSIYGEAPPMKALALARAAAEKALSIDEHLAEAHTSLAYVKMNFETDLSDAAREFERAIELNPNYATAHQWYSRCLIIMGRNDDAIREARRAELLDPLSLVIIAEAGGVYSDSNRFDEAISECRRALDLEPKFPLAHYILAGVYLKQHRFDDAIAQAEKAWTDGADGRSLVRLGVSYVAAGRDKDAAATLQKLEQLARERFVPSYGIAVLSAAIGDRDKAFAALKRAREEIPPGQYRRLIEEDSLLSSLRSDPRFKPLAAE
jgi:tetratricopeptide (TPR) repeat protein